MVFYVLGRGIDWGSRENITVGEKPVKSGPGALFLILFSMFLRCKSLFSQRIEITPNFELFGTGNELMICCTFGGDLNASVILLYQNATFSPICSLISVN